MALQRRAAGFRSSATREGTQKRHAEMHEAVGRVIQKNEQGESSAEKLLKEVETFSQEPLQFSTN